MLSMEEIYLLNTAVDKRDIFGLPPLDSLGLNTLLLDAVGERLVKKGILEGPAGFTASGARITKRIEDYKNAERYIKLGGLVFGATGQQAVLLHRLPDTTFIFERVNPMQAARQALEYYTFLREPYPEAKTAPLAVTPAQLSERYPLPVHESIFLSTLDMRAVRAKRENTVTNEIVFKNGNSLYIYDRQAAVLQESTGDFAQQLLLERMTG